MRILLALDGSRYALAAARFVAEHLAQPGRIVEVIHVLPAVVREGSAAPRHQPATVRMPPASRAWLERAARRLQARGLAVRHQVRRGSPARLIPELISKGNYDLVVLGAKGRGEVPYLPTGSVALAVLEQHVPANVLLVRERNPREAAGRGAARPLIVLFPTDGSKRIAHTARSFQRLFDRAYLQPVALAVAPMPVPAVLAALQPPERERLGRSLREAAGRWAREAKPLLARPNVTPAARVRQGDPASVILEEAARTDAGLLVLGSRGAASPTGPPLGSVALAVARRAVCSVLLVRQP